jgi:outer membrane protein OmpA-like peptidoglycan-associated protein
MGELDRYDCTYSKEITIPFDYTDSLPYVKPQLNQVVFYSYRDQFTYWYKITAKSNDKLKFKVFPIKDSDSYVIYIYQYNNADFCNKLYNQKLKPISTPFYIGNNTKELDYKTLTIQKENIYYISILNTSMNNCGHNFRLAYGNDTLKVKAFHSPCKKDITTLSITEKLKEPLKDTVAALPPKIVPIIKDTIAALPPKVVPVIKDTVAIIPPKIEPIIQNTVAIVPPKIVPIIKDTVKTIEPALAKNELNNRIECFVRDKKKLNLINSNLTVIDLDTKEYIIPVSLITGKWGLILEKGKDYKIKCTAFGYNDLEVVWDLSKGEAIELFLEPLKVGDNFIMKSIYFHPNTYALRQESADELQRLLQYMTDNPSVNIEIQGYTNGDNRIYKNKAYENLGEEWNFQGSSKTLSLKRSESIKKYLVNNGINEERLFPTGQGGDKPIYENPETMEEGQRNIRVEILILKN